MHKEKISKFVNSSEYIPMTRDNMAILLCVPEHDRNLFNTIIDELIKEGVIVEGRKKRLFSASAMGLVCGVFHFANAGYGFVSNENGDIYIPCENVNGALNGDTVLVKIKKSKNNDKKKREGAILSVTIRSEKIIVGVYVQERGYGIVLPDDEKLPREIFVNQQYSMGALNGQKVVCEITEYESATTSLCCKVKEILGFPNDFGVDVLSVIKSYGFPTNFSRKAIDEANAIGLINENDFKDRLDLTNSTIFTIDGEDTKDIDDAISVEKKDDGYVLGVHIADVSHYVTPFSQLDKEAYERGTSVYPVDRVIPMLPVKLSNGICSLNEGEVRLTLSVFIEYDNGGNVVSSSFYKSYIKSKAKMTYEDVKSIICEKTPELVYKYSEILKSIENMYELYCVLYSKTQNRGSIDLSIPESKAVLDENGKTIDIVLRKNSFANRIIEEFMVAANSEVAKFLCKKGVGALYRVHEEPLKEKLENTLNFMYNKGYGHDMSIKSILKAVSGTEKEEAFSMMLLKCMSKAKYGFTNGGHYGLALENYCHFTSPIRRYPDLICHRALKSIIENDLNIQRYLKAFVKEAAEKCSKRENDAAMCERDTLDIKKAEYMEKLVGHDFDGVISSVIPFGFFVMLPNTVEGLVRADTLSDDYFVYDEKAFSLYGERTGRIFTIGDKVKVKLVNANKSMRKIDFKLLEGGVNNGRRRKKKDTCSKQKRSPRVFHRRKIRGRH